MKFIGAFLRNDGTPVDEEQREIVDSTLTDHRYVAIVRLDENKIHVYGIADVTPLEHFRDIRELVEKLGYRRVNK